MSPSRRREEPLDKALHELGGTRSKRAHRKLDAPPSDTNPLGAPPNDAFQQLDQIKRQHDAVLRSTPHGLCILSSQWRLTWANRAFIDLFNCSDDTGSEIIGTTFEGRFPSAAEFKEYAKTAIHSIREAGSDKREMQLLKTNGSPFWCEISLVRHDPVSTGPGFVATLTDQTERRRAEQLLRERERHFRSLVQNSLDMLFVYAADGRVTYSNPAVERVLDYPAEAMVGKSGFEMVHPDDLPNARTFFKNLLKSPDRAISTAFRVRHRDGSWRDIEGIATNLLHDASIRGIVANARDVTERKRAEDALARSEEKYRTLVESVTDALYEVDLEGNVIFANAALVRMVGYPLDEIIGRNNRDFMDEESARRNFETFDMVRRTGQPRHGFSYQVTAKGGVKKIVEGSISIVRDAAGQPTGFLKVIRDITERRKAEEALEQKTRQLERANHDLIRKNAELDEFTYIASHDLQEPLRKLTAFSDFLRNDLGGNLPPRAAKDLGFIVDAASRMQILVQDLLQLSRAGKADLKRERVELNLCLKHALETLALRIESSGAKIECDDLPAVWGDRTTLTQVFQNLLSNAIKFAANAPPLIHVTCEKSDDQWVIGVRDNGIGLRPEYAEQIFAPFKRLHGRDKYEGTGIGLSICRKGVDRHGGKIWVESRLGEGAHFKFTLGERGRSRNAGEESS